MKKDKGIATSFAVELQIEKVTATACDKYLVKLKRALNLYNSYSEREREELHSHIFYHKWLSW